MDSILIELVALGVDVAIFSVCYKLYCRRSESCRALKEAPVLEINRHLPDRIHKSDSIIPYAVISGVVKATAPPLKSQFVPHMKGVIREKITKERKIRWSPMLRLWNTVEDDIQRSLNSVPFVLSSKGGWLSAAAAVEVVDPLTAEKFTLPTVYDDFISHQDSLGEAVVGWFRGERTTGIQEIEKMLCEGSVLTGVGELVIENNEMKLQPPSSGLSYFLTSLSVDSLIKKLDEDARIFKKASIIFGCLGAFLLTYMVTYLYQTKKRQWDLRKHQRQVEEERKRRRLQDPTRNEENNSNRPVCVVCLTNPVEVIILECGHACLCLSCSEQISEMCPVCRSRVDRIVTAFLP